MIKDLSNNKKGQPCNSCSSSSAVLYTCDDPVSEVPGMIGLGRLDTATPELALLGSKGSLETPAQTAAH